MKDAIIIFIFSFIHKSGWCKSWHRSEIAQQLGKGECHLVDSILVRLFPMYKVEDGKFYKL